MKKTINSLLFFAVAGLTAYTAGAAAPTLTGMDVGAPGQPGSVTVAGDKITVVGGGADIWGSSDSFYYAYMPVTGDFDYVVKVESLVGNVGDGGWSKAELMARLPMEGTGDTPGADDPHLSNMVNRPASDIPPTDPWTSTAGVAGVNNRGPQWRAHRAGEGTDPDGNAWTGASSWTTPNPAYPPNPPNQWLRMERVGSVLYMYTSNDGTTWNMYNPYSPQGWDTAGSWPTGTDNPTQAYFTNAWPAKILLGLAVTAHYEGASYEVNTSTAVFSGFQPYTPIPVAITTQPPATVDIAANSQLAISVAATGDPVHYQWRRNGNPIPRAVGPTYTVPLAQTTDSGTYTCRVFGGGTEVISSATVVTVTVDTTPPTLTSVKVDGRYGLNLRFSEPVTTATATQTGAYVFSPALVVSSAVLSGDGFSVNLTTAQQALNTQYTVTINGIKDTAGNTIATDTKANFTSVSLLAGKAYYERWTDSSGDMGDINAFARSIFNGTAREPDVTSLVSQFGGPWGATDEYNGRVRTYFTPPSNGNYVFFVAADDAARVYLSTDDKPANKKLVAQESGWSNQYQWTAPGAGAADDKRSDLYANTYLGTAQEDIYPEWPGGNTITLQANRTYFMEVLWNEGGGGDGADVTFIKEGEADPTNDAAGMHMLGDTVISWFQSTEDLPPTIATHPVNNLTLNPGDTATLTVEATNPASDALTYQWTLNGVDIPGATSASYTIASATVNDMGQYRVKVSNKNGTVWSGDGAPNPTCVLVTATDVFAIEAEDFDYDSGKSKDEASVMPYLGGAYAGLSAVWGVDYNNDDEPANSYVNVDGLTDPQEYNNPPDHPVYRYGGDLDIGFDAADPNKNATMSSEMGAQWTTTRAGEWTMTANYKVGWVGSGNWGNYTRTFPTPAKPYYIFAASSYDGVNDGQINGSIGRVTAGVGTATQTVEPLATYTAQGSGDWSRNNLVGARGTDGQLTEVELGGKQTIRWTYNSGDAEYLLFIPVDQGGTVEIKSISLSGGNVVIEYTGVLQSSAVVTGPFTDVIGATSPYSTGATAAQMYFRSRQ